MTTTVTPTNEKEAGRQPGFLKGDDDSQFSTPARPVSSPRALRLLAALLDGSLSREALDRTIGASNSPDVVFQLRQRGFDLPCKRREVLDRDGRPCRIGVYSLTASDADKARAILAERGAS